MLVDVTTTRSALFRPDAQLWPSAPERPIGTSEEVTPVGELSLLGGFRLVLRGELVDVSTTGQRLVAVLVCHSGSVARRQIAHLLWPDATTARAHANLRTVIYRLERTCPGLIVVCGSYLRLAGGLRIDLDETTALANRILATEGPLPAAVRTEALDAGFHHDLLPDLDDEWLLEYQTRYHQLRLAALETLSRRLASEGLPGAAVCTALALVQADSLRDSAHQTLIRACLVQGNQQEALSYFADYQRVFRDELGVEPASSIGQLLDEPAAGLDV
ncbi:MULTISPECIES: BTAD domain-containing putative transcriptional regulator [unclassified Amycolatopsis]|uniref:AfsR/SARP family transcriptional regulator n=1 Tax=unclassified Amycolatopsis TaxID=2618356 RepID=UPI00287523EE|nr:MULTISPECIES: BTAD domain-containing putative transcriptional regulator [unclassified Amycolatopsis]MDS0134505.1 SARP family transcriptional regulator [Amycolatopsis sp. 505]MDS0147853.1 SARP family transcriptional regulator [Amycolatopsis sp. CM201R]